MDCNRSYSRRSTGAGTFRAISQRTAPAIDEATPPGSRLAGQLPGQSVLGRVGQQLGVLLLHHDVDQIVVVQAHLGSNPVSSRRGGAWDQLSAAGPDQTSVPATELTRSVLSTDVRVSGRTDAESRRFPGGSPTMSAETPVTITDITAMDEANLERFVG